MRKCGNCKNRCFHSWFGIDYCIWYEMAVTEADEIKAAADCGKYEAGDPFEDDDYTPSCTAGDYGPGNPWDAPGMSVRDFI